MRKISHCKKCGSRRGLRWATPEWPYCDACQDAAIAAALADADWAAAHPCADATPEGPAYTGEPERTPTLGWGVGFFVEECGPWRPASETWATDSKETEE